MLNSESEKDCIMVYVILKYEKCKNQLQLAGGLCLEIQHWESRGMEIRTCRPTVAIYCVGGYFMGTFDPGLNDFNRYQFNNKNKTFEL